MIAPETFDDVLSDDGIVVRLKETGIPSLAAPSHNIAR
ncbi:hypothetical protein RGCCGE502_32721 (plasmid) [Rhizobium grahamii CCGE 502]|uniref:Uncharacterized protein n=1 Tax=Rhizobium grahamii CCGE 502 TaxID=990285 RepID=S3H5Y3_9HYPH|nr:hypothetical protein RGCCGE502_32721 [Rhizobium grahamii CCGE 502]